MMVYKKCTIKAEYVIRSPQITGHFVLIMTNEVYRHEMEYLKRYLFVMWNLLYHNMNENTAVARWL